MLGLRVGAFACLWVEFWGFGFLLVEMLCFLGANELMGLLEFVFV